MVNFSRAFDLAWERMHIILFRPFNFGKWCAIGLSAFLAGLLWGGNGLNFSGNGGGNFNTPSTTTGNLSGPITPSDVLNHSLNKFNSEISTLQVGMIVLIVALIFMFIVALTVLMYWLRARRPLLD